MNSDKHLFACFFENLSQVAALKKGGNLSFKDAALHGRLVKILRLKAGQRVILFDRVVKVVFELDEACIQSSSKVIGTIVEVENNQKLTPEIILYQGLTKKNAFESIVYTAGQMGVSKIVPLLSEKIHKNWITKKDHTRLESLMIAACEQSKQLVLPEFAEPKKIDHVVNVLGKDSLNIVFDVQGQPFKTIFDDAASLHNQTIHCFLGPEGGFSEHELSKLEQLGVTSCALTPMILRSVDAIIVGLGIIRSYVRD